jgi:hypothetical protein
MAKKKKNGPEKDAGLGRKSDHLKYYCVVFGILVIVIAVVAFQQRAALNDYVAANAFADKLLTGKGLPTKTAEGRPNRLADLAVEVEKFVQGFKNSIGDQAAGGEGISTTKMEQAAFAVNMKQRNAGPENDDPNRGKGFRTRYREFTYEECSLEQLTKLIWNIESWGRYRVFELRWHLEEGKENSEPPFNRLRKPVIKVGYRQPLTRER